MLTDRIDGGWGDWRDDSIQAVHGILQLLDVKLISDDHQCNFYRSHSFQPTITRPPIRTIESAVGHVSIIDKSLSVSWLFKLLFCNFSLLHSSFLRFMRFFKIFYYPKVAIVLADSSLSFFFGGRGRSKVKWAGRDQSDELHLRGKRIG